MTIIRSYPDIEHDNLALLIIDMQGDFLDEGAPVLIPEGRKIVSTLQHLLKEARVAGIPIIHAMVIWQKDGADAGLFSTSPELQTHGLREGEPGVAIIPELAPIDGEYIVVKKRYSAFFQTNLELLLRSLRIQYLIVTGVATNYCVRSTVHDACFRDMMSIVPRECVASYTDEEHEQSLQDIANGFGQVKSTDEVVQLLRRVSAAPPSLHRNAG